jgi:hypothetical protein
MRGRKAVTRAARIEANARGGEVGAPAGGRRRASGHPLQSLHDSLGNRGMQRLAAARVPAPPDAGTALVGNDQRPGLGHESTPFARDPIQNGLPWVQCKADGMTDGVSSGRAAEALTGLGPGLPLDAESRAFMEAGFGRDLGGVRIHNDPAAARSARMLSAKAFTVGNDIYFAHGRYAPDTNTGRRLLAHELTHTIQQTNSAGVTTAATGPPVVSRPEDASEHEAEAIADRVVSGASSGPVVGGPSVIARVGADPAAVSRDVVDAGPIAGAPSVTADDATDPAVVTQPSADPGEHVGKVVGHWGVWDPTPLTAQPRVDQNFGTFEAATAYARGLAKAAAIFQEDDVYVVYPVSYSAVFYSFTYEGTRQYRDENMSDVQGEPGALAFATEDGALILPHEYQGQTNPKWWMDQQDRVDPDSDPFDAHKEAFGEGLAEIADKDKFLSQFELAMKDVALQTLARSEAEAKTKQQETANGLPAADAKTIHETGRKLEALDGEISDWEGKQQTAKMNVEHPVLFAPDFNDRAMKDLEAANAKLNDLRVQRNKLLLAYPLLSHFDAAEVAEFNKKTDDEQGAALHGAAGDVIENVHETQFNVQSGKLNLWTLTPLVDATLVGLGVTDDVRRQWALDKSKSEQTWDTITTVALAVLQIGFAVAATVLSGGAAGFAFAVGALAVGVTDAIRTTSRYAVDVAAAGTDVNTNQALVPADLSGQWAFVVLAWVGVGLDFGFAVSAVRELKAGLEAEEAIIHRIAKQANVDEEALRGAFKRNILGAAKPDPAALGKLLRSALPAELSKRYAGLEVKVLSEAEWTAKFGQGSEAEAATLFTKGEGGELVPEVFFRETGNPLAVREEAVHVAQLADKETAPKIAGLVKVESQWATLSIVDKAKAYRTTLELEIDAQRKLLSGYAHEAEAAEDIKTGLQDLEKRLAEVDEALKDPEALAKKPPAWLELNEPPALFARPRLPQSNGHWSNPAKPGNSLWYSDNPDVKSIVGKEGIPFRNRYPVFQKWSKATARIEEMAGDATDFTKANKQLAKQNGWFRSDGVTPDAARAGRWMEENNLIWHHHQGGRTMLAVPEKLHANVPHTGGASQARAGL